MWGVSWDLRTSHMYATPQIGWDLHAPATGDKRRLLGVVHNTKNQIVLYKTEVCSNAWE